MVRAVRHAHIIIRIILSFLAFTVLANSARAGEGFYVIMMAYQTIPNEARYAHSFATYVHATWSGQKPEPGNVKLESHTISWLPATTILRPLALCPECGRNFGLEETIRVARGFGARVTLWGPYLIEPELFERACARVEELESGRVRYKMFDDGRRDDHVSNCIHGVSAINRAIRLRIASPAWGEVASFVILEKQRRWIVDTSCTCDWLIECLGLDAHPIIYRDWSMPVSGAFLSPAYRYFGGEQNLAPTYGPPACRRSRHHAVEGT